jgi:hypothetical protein
MNVQWPVHQPTAAQPFNLMTVKLANSEQKMTYSHPLLQSLQLSLYMLTRPLSTKVIKYLSKMSTLLKN